MLLWSHLSNNYALVIGAMLEIMSNEEFYFLLSCTILPVLKKIWKQLRVKTHKLTYKLMCIYSGQLEKLFQGRIHNHN